MSTQIAFAALLALSGYSIYRRVIQLRFNILMGTPYKVNTPFAFRLKNMLLVAFGQSKMFDKPFLGIMHLFIYVGFVLINIEILEILLDGLLGTHRVFLPFLDDLYTPLIQFFETLALLVVVACVVFLIRRNVLKIDRFRSAEMTQWPRLDANIILVVEIALMFALFTMNATDQLLQERPDSGGQYPLTGNFWVSSMFMPLYDGLSTPALLVLERVAWWVHITGILAFAVYVTYSKHLHIALAFPNTYFASDKPKGKIENMEAVTREVNLMLGLSTPESSTSDSAVKRFGAKDVTDLTWKNLMDAYSCTECGRCTASCPANITGKKLSPRKIMMDTRDRADALGELRIVGAKDLKLEGQTLLDHFITREEILACNTCNACVEACPVNINPLDIIVQLRRYAVMEESSAPTQWNAMFSNLENNMAPWKFSPSDRANWIEKVNASS